MATVNKRSVQTEKKRPALEVILKEMEYYSVNLSEYGVECDAVSLMATICILEKMIIPDKHRSKILAKLRTCHDCLVTDEKKIDSERDGEWYDNTLFMLKRVIREFEK